MDPVHEVVDAVMVAYLSKPGVVEAGASKPDALRVATEARDGVLARMDTAADSFALGQTTARQFARINGLLKEQLESADQEVRRLQPNRILDGMTGPGAAAAWAATSIERKREIIRTLVTITILPSGPGVRFSPEQVEIVPKS
jgi:ribosomal protein RSM22 (predicted rRNA methylase)